MPTKDTASDTVRRFWREVLNQRNYQLIPSMFADHYTFNGAEQTPAELESFLKSLDVKWNDIDYCITELVADEGTVTARVKFTGTWPESGEVYTSWSINLIEIKDGKATSCWQPPYVAVPTRA